MDRAEDIVKNRKNTPHGTPLLSSQKEVSNSEIFVDYDNDGEGGEGVGPSSARIASLESSPADSSNDGACGDDDDDGPLPSSSAGEPSLAVLSSFLSPFTDETGSPQTVLSGMAMLLFFGTILGLIAQKDASLPTPAYRTFSSIIGYTYFLAWSVSFYPQLLSNCRRRTTQGLSADFASVNVLGFACYAVYNGSFFWSPAILREYRKRQGDDAEVTVQSNDVAFAVHAFVLTSITLCQIGYFDGRRALKPSKCMSVFIASAMGFIALFAILILSGVDKLKWLDFVYALSWIKVVITLTKYVPQVLLNYRRKSTDGWNIWTVLTDITGGLLSVLQLVLDSADVNDWGGITGNLAKFLLGFVSICFDIIFIVQHYVLYPQKKGSSDNNVSSAVQAAMEEESDYDYDALV